MSSDPLSGNGRECAIEALMDLEPRGALCRAVRVMKDSPVAALSSRPNRITNAALLESALSLSKYEIAGYRNEHVDPFLKPTTNTLDAFTAKIQGAGSEECKKDKKSLESEHQRVMRHHAKIVMAKTRAAKSRVLGAESPVPPTAPEAAIPPPQLVFALRKVFGATPLNQVSSLDTEENESAQSFILPSLLRFVANHRVFSVAKQAMENMDNNGILKMESTEQAKAEARVQSKEEEARVQSKEEEAAAACNIFSPSANIETIVGNACYNSVHANDKAGQNADLLGLVIAALSVLAGCILDEDGTDDISRSDTRFDTSDVTSLNSISRGDQNVMPLQVGGALSILSVVFSDKVVDDAANSGIMLIDAEISQYLMQAASAYEEIIEIKKAKATARTSEEVEQAGLNQVSSGKEKDHAATSDSTIVVVDTGLKVVAQVETPILSSPQPVPVTPSMGVNSSLSVIDDDQELSSGRRSAFLREPFVDASADSSFAHPTDPDELGHFNGDDNDESGSDDDDDEEESGSDDDEESGSDDDSGTTIGYGDVLAHAHQGHRVLLEATGGVVSNDDVEHENDDDSSNELSSSSSSSSSEDDGMEELVEGEEEGDSDEDDNDADDNDADMLQRALAMSLAEHSTAVVDTGTTYKEDTASVAEAHSSIEHTEAHDTNACTAADLVSASSNSEVAVDGVQCLIVESDSIGRGGRESCSNTTELLELKDSTFASVINDNIPAQTDSVLEVEEDDDYNLPTLPSPPSQYPYASLLPRSSNSTICQDADDVKVVDIDDAKINSYLDPNSFSSFGLLPSTSVLLHLLQYAVYVVELQGCSIGVEKEAASPVCPCPGGVGSVLFPPKQNSCRTRSTGRAPETDLHRALDFLSSNSTKAQITETRDDQMSQSSVIIYLLVALLNLLSNLRLDALHKLRSTLVERSVSVLLSSTDVRGETKDDGCDERGNEVSVDAYRDYGLDETDDPAFAIISNTAAPSHAAFASSSSECFETKGMRRKAAAAAQVATLRKEKTQKRAQKFKEVAGLYSLSSYLVMKCLRIFLQTETEKENTALFSTLARSRLSESLAIFMNPEISSLCHSLLKVVTSQSPQSIPIVNVTESELLPVPLFRESLFLWSECVPLLFPSHTERENQLLSLIRDCFPFSLDGSESCDFVILSFTESPISAPWSESVERLFKLDALCRRLRMSDQLDSFVSHPMIFGTDATQDNATKNSSFTSVQDDNHLVFPAGRPSSVLSTLGKAISLQALRAEKLRSDNVTQFYCALSHRVCLNMLMWNDPTLCAADDTLGNDDIVHTRASLSSSESGIDGNLRLKSNPAGFDFDSTRCADSIAILPTSPSNSNGLSAHQRASKVWGTVLSTKYFHPKTGVHRWAVCLNKCERGHVFVGVSTAQASIKTYVGGDKHGWGVIGTQALWHDRSKIRGDYGGTFRTGAIVVVTLDTDSGTLSFGLWNDPNQQPTSEGTSASQITNLASPRRNFGSTVSATLEDWGIAFEGLPLDAKLYPAVGLYQRDDKVTLLSVTSSLGIGVGGKPGNSVSTFGEGLTAGERYYPCNLFATLSDPPNASDAVRTESVKLLSFQKGKSKIKQVQQWNRSFCIEGLSCASVLLSHILRLFASKESRDVMHRNPLFTHVLPSVASSLCFTPSSIPVLSGTAALSLLPLVIRCAVVIESQVDDKSRSLSPASNMKSGKWVIRASPSSGLSGSAISAIPDQFEEYLVLLSADYTVPNGGCNFHGNGTGTTGRYTHGRVSIVGNARGTSVQFTEEWTDDGSADKVTGSLSSSSCVIDARLSLDGCRFEGIYRNVQFGTSGIISGIHCDYSLPLTTGPSQSAHLSSIATITTNVSIIEEEGTLENYQTMLVRNASLLSLAANHLAIVIAVGAPSTDLRRSLDFHNADIDLVLEGNIEDVQMKNRKDELALFITSSPILTGGLSNFEQLHGRPAVSTVRDLFSLPASYYDVDYSEIVSEWQERVFDLQLKFSSDSTVTNFSTKVNNKVDEMLVRVSGGPGSLASLNKERYDSARRSIVAVILHHTGLVDQANAATDRNIDLISEVWRCALVTMESGLRKSLAAVMGAMSHRDVCVRFCDRVELVSEFLQSAYPAVDFAVSKKAIMNGIESFYGFVLTNNDVAHIQAELNVVTQLGVLRHIGLAAFNNLLSSGMRTEAVLECSLLSLPRLLGRGDIALNTKSSHTPEDLVAKDEAAPAVICEDIGGHYLTPLKGCYFPLQHRIRVSVHEIFLLLGKLLSCMVHVDTGDASHLDGFSSPSSQSLILALTSSFILTMRPPDFEGLIVRPGLWESIRTIFSRCQQAVQSDDTYDCSADLLLTSSLLGESWKRHVNLSILRCVVSIIHVTVFQLGQNAILFLPHEHDLACVIALRTKQLLEEEFQRLFAITNEQAHRSREKARLVIAKVEWDRWSETREVTVPMAEKISKSRISKRNPSSTNSAKGIGLRYMLENGTFSLQGKASLPSLAPGYTDHAFKSLDPVYQHLTTLLNILHATACSPLFPHKMEFSPTWAQVLLGAVTPTGNTFGNPEYCVPIRFRLRILRLLRYILPAMQSDNSIALRLFGLLGDTCKVSALTLLDTGCSTDTAKYDEHQMANEIVSLLRLLHAPENATANQSRSHTWRQAIHEVMNNPVGASYRSHGCNDSLQRGILAFFGGIPGRISAGSFVLLKPSSAAYLSQCSSSSSSKSSGTSSGNSSTGGNPPVVVGSGMEGIVTGLCRQDAMAGMVSQVDIASGACEVILIDRRTQDRLNFCYSPNRRGNAYTPVISVRAVRARMSDVVSADELPLLLDVDIPISNALAHPLSNALQDLISIISSHEVSTESSKLKASDIIMTNAKMKSTDKSDVYQHDLPSILTSVAMSLRSSIVLLSDARLLQQCMNNSVVKDCFSRLLRIASTSSVSQQFPRACSACSESLGFLPEHEARYWHLQGMLSDASIRMNALDSIPESDWHLITDKCANKDDVVTRTPFKTLNCGESIEDGYSTPPATVGVVSADVGSAFESSSLRARNEAIIDGELSRHSNRQSSTGTNTSSGGIATEEEDDGESDEVDEAARLAEETAAAHLREAAIVQMAELGLPRSWSEYALRRVGGTNIEAAVHFCLERGGDMERLLSEERERERRMMSSTSATSGAGRRRNFVSGGGSGGTSHLIRQLIEMGFPSHWCTEALAATGNNVDEALTWILTNGERLSAQDEGNDDDEVDDDDEDDSMEEEDELTGNIGGEENSRARTVSTKRAERAVSDISPNASNLSGTSKTELSEKLAAQPTMEWPQDVICPVRSVSGRSNVNPKTLEVSGLPTGGFSSVGTKGVLLTTGKWYYEAVLLTAGCLQIGWADSSFAGHCQADRGDGCGDGPSSWAYDGWRRYRWHSSATEWGCRWQKGDVVGCLVDMDDKVISYTLNGKGEEIGMGIAFSGSGFRPCGGVYACVSFNRKEQLRLVLGRSGNKGFHYLPPADYRGVGEAVLEACVDRCLLVKEEQILSSHCLSLNKTNPTIEDEGFAPISGQKRYLCDFSDGEHGHELFAWQHRYYGSDASVHLGAGNKSSARSGSRSARSQRNSSGSGVGSSTYHNDSSTSRANTVTSRLVNAWGSISKEEPPSEFIDSSEAQISGAQKSAILHHMNKGYDIAIAKISAELCDTSVSLSIHYARKLILHLIVTLSGDFKLQYMLPAASESVSDGDEEKTALRLWRVIELCCSLHAAGWVGEAGAMAVAAESLGLGISSHDHHSVGSGGDSTTGMTLAGGSDVIGASAVVPVGGITQVLSTVRIAHEGHRSFNLAREPAASLAACAEAALGGDGGGSLVFLRHGLQCAAIHSSRFRDVLIAVIRRSVRLLAVVEYGKDDGSTSSSGDVRVDDDEEADQSATIDQKAPAENSGVLSPDARVVSFLSGLLLSNPVRSSWMHLETMADQTPSVAARLFEAWSVGLLSASSPWRMVCALTTSGILNLFPGALPYTTNRISTLKRYFSRLDGTVARRVWAERAAVPVCSRYVQAFIDLLSSVRRSLRLSSYGSSSALELSFVDAATPLPLKAIDYVNEKGADSDKCVLPSSWEWDESWSCSDAGWEIWTGTVECMAVEWIAPSRSAVRTLMDGGDGPPMLREGCAVIRGLDWDDDGGSGCRNEDGKDLYELEKDSREKEKRLLDNSESEAIADSATANNGHGDIITPEDRELPAPDENENILDLPTQPSNSKAEENNVGTAMDSEQGSSKKKKKKGSNLKLPIGTVLSVEPWNGICGLGRRIRWHLTGKEGLYRYGGDGGKYDIAHVDVNEKETKIRKRHPLPESAEQCAARYGFGLARKHNVLLRLRRHTNQGEADSCGNDFVCKGILEWPDFGAGVIVECQFHDDGAVTIREEELLFGPKDSGWEARFGQPSYFPGSVTVVSSTKASSSTSTGEDGVSERQTSTSQFEELLGSSSHLVDKLRNRVNGGRVRLTSEMRFIRGKTGTRATQIDGVKDPNSLVSSILPPINFDRDYHAPSIALSRDGRTVTCVTSDGRGTAFGSVGFTKGVHYWEVKLEQADTGSVFIGVAEKPNASSSAGGATSFGFENQPRLNRWHGWGFVNFRATYTAGAERVYGAHCHAGDTVGVLLDCDAGRISFFFDGIKYDEHILNDLGCAFENVSPFGFNVDGCGSGGAGQGAPSGIDGGRGGRYPANGAVRPKTLWPVVGLRNQGDRVTLSGKWMTSYGVDGVTSLRNALAVDEILCHYHNNQDMQNASNLSAPSFVAKELNFPKWFVHEAYLEYQRWLSGRWLRSPSRGSGPYPLASLGLDIDLDASPLACASACASLGLSFALLSGDRVAVKRSAGQLLALPEEAVILGAYQGRLFYKIISQKSEGGSLMEGGGRAWFWDESEVVDGGIRLIGEGRGLNVQLPLLDRFKCISPGGLRIVYSGGAVVRSDLEIFDGSASIGTVPKGTVVPQKNVLERRVNSCGVVRYLIKFDPIGEGWISSRIRGGKEEPIVETVWTPPLSIATDSKKSLDFVLTKARVNNDSVPRYVCAEDAARVWFDSYTKALRSKSTFQASFMAKSSSLKDDTAWSLRGFSEFDTLLHDGIISGLSELQSDSLMSSMLSSIADLSPSGDAVDCPFDFVASAVHFGVSNHGLCSIEDNVIKSSHSSPAANQAAAEILAKVEVALPSTKAILARIAMLRALNRRARYALPWLSTRPPQEGSAILGGLSGFGASVDRAGRSKDTHAMKLWVQPSSIGSRIRSCRALIFSCVKRALLDSMMDATTTPTPLSHDEYELPREVRTVRVNRLKARRAMTCDDFTLKRKHSVLFQLQHEMRGWSGAALRRGHVAKGHGGQKRAFKIKLVGEGVNDYSGPYREVFTDAIREATETDSKGQSALGILEPSPNNFFGIGEARSLFVFSSGETSDNNGQVSLSRNGPHRAATNIEKIVRNFFSSYVGEKAESVREVEEILVFLGRLAGTACRHGIPVDLPLSLKLVWNRLTEEEVDLTSALHDIDTLTFSSLSAEEKSAVERDVSAIPMLALQQRMLNSFTEGMASVLPVELFAMFSGHELRDVVCGNPEIDVELLRRVVEYEGYEEGDAVIRNFWDALRDMTTLERKLFLQFVWARSRLPVKESDFEAPFKIQKDSNAIRRDANAPLPSASTCFFTLSLPEYDNKEILKKKLLFAINNVTTMESDYVTNDAEVGEGWRGI